jgi:hypothetical protein
MRVPAIVEHVVSDHAVSAAQQVTSDGRAHDPETDDADA